MTATTFDTLKFATTKAELHDVEQRANNRVDAIDTKLDAIRHEMKAEFASLNSKIDTMKWVGLLLAIIFVAPTIKMLVS